MLKTYGLLAFLSLAACGPQFAVVPRGGAPQVQSTVANVTLTAFANQWDADPDDLADYITPIAVDIYNASPYEVRVSYADFALTDQRGFRYAALNPFSAATVGANESSPSHALAPKESNGVLY